jgi:hypothetical protein
MVAGRSLRNRGSRGNRARSALLVFAAAGAALAAGVALADDTAASAVAAAASAVAAATPAPLEGTPIRVIPANAPMAELVMTVRPSAGTWTARLGDNTVGLAPGLRLFSTENQLLNTNLVAGKKLPVRYQLDVYGQLLTAWILTRDEVKAMKASQ